MCKTREQRKSRVPGIDWHKWSFYADSSWLMGDNDGVGEGSMVSVYMDAAMDECGHLRCAILSPLYMVLVWVSPITFRSTKERFKVTQASK